VKLSFVIPAYNEEESIPVLYHDLTHVLTAMHSDYELIFIDDGSTDNSQKIICELKKKDPKARIITLKENCGQSAAFDCGIKNAHGSLIITIDGDNQNDPQDIPRMLNALEDNDAVIGWRTQRKDPLSKRISSRIANYVRNKISCENVHDTGCSLKLFRKEALENITLYHGMHRFLPTLVKIEGKKVVEIPVNHRPRTRGQSKYNTRKRAIKPSLIFWL